MNVVTEERALSRGNSRLLPLPHERVPVPDIYVEGKPTLILDRRTARRTGRDAIMENLAAAEFMRDLAKTIFGPQRLIKMISVHDGKFPVTFVTSDLQSALKRIKLRHPAAQLLAGAAISTHREKGDGCVSTLLLATSILSSCRSLLLAKTHPNVIIDGLQLAYQRILSSYPRLVIAKRYDSARAIEVGIRNSLAGKLSSTDHEFLSSLLIAAVRKVGVSNLTGPEGVDVIDLKKVVGGALEDSQLVDGIVLTQEIPRESMPHRVENARIALLQCELRLPNRKITRYQDYGFEFNSVEQFATFEESKREYLEGLVSKVIDSDANVVLVQEGVDDYLLDLFAARGTLVIRRFPPIEFQRVNRALGGRMIPNPRIMGSQDLAHAKLVEERKIGHKTLIFITGCTAPATVDIILRGSVKWALDDLERVMKGAIRAAITMAKNPRLVWGGGAFEQQLAMDLLSYSSKLPDKKQLVLRAIAEGFESIPAILAETVGLKPYAVATNLRNRHAKGEISAGVDPHGKRVTRMASLGVVDSLDVKLQVIKAAFEVAMTILRVDDFVLMHELTDAERHYVERVQKTSDSFND